MQPVFLGRLPAEIQVSESHDSRGSGGRKRGKPSPAAVALHYQPETEYAPKVVAKGRGAIAEQILEIAFAHGIKVREDADLAELLSLLDIDTEIPLEAFAAVAEILAHVYRANAALPPAPDAPPTEGDPAA